MTFDEFIAEMTVKKHYTSRRNEVFLVQKTDMCAEKAEMYVVKRCLYEQASNEADMLRKLHGNGIKVPAVIAEGSDWLLVEYIKGELLGDATEGKDSQWCAQLIGWLADFHAYCDRSGTDICNCDINLRNFIVGVDGIYGIDFEDMQRKHPGIMIGALAAHLLTFGDILSNSRQKTAAEFLRLCAENIILSRQKTAYAVWKEAFSLEMEALAARRKQQTSIINHWVNDAGETWFEKALEV